MRPQETTETKYNGPVEGKKYYLSIKKSYTCSSYQDKCFHLISFIRQSNTYSVRSPLSDVTREDLDVIAVGPSDCRQVDAEAAVKRLVVFVHDRW